MTVISTTLSDFSVIVFSSIERALEKMKGEGGWFWWRYDTGEGFWFNPRRWTRDEISMSDHVRGDGYLAMWSDMQTHASLAEQAGEIGEEDARTVALQLGTLDRRPLCPRCGAPLYAAIESYASGAIPTWEGEDGAYGGLDADPDDGHHRESDLVRLYCSSCEWSADPRQVAIEVER